MSSKSTIFISTLIFCMISGLIINVSAHPPSTLNLKYSAELDILSITISHSVSDNNTHYIETVEITLNSETPEVYSYTSQLSTSQFTYEYELDASIGDTITVKITCNISGSLTKTLTLQSESTSTSETTTPTPSISGFTGVLLFISAGVCLLLLHQMNRIRKKTKNNQ